MPLPATGIAERRTVSRALPCQVWIADLADYRTELRGLLDGLELARRQRYQQSADRRRFTMAVALLRVVAGRQLGRPARQLVIDRDCPGCNRQHGKPRLRDAAGLHVSVSHSGELVAVATTPAAPIGVDIEVVTERDYLGLARAFLAPGETVDGPDSFYTMWTRKEAVIKATGDGLRMPLPQVAVSAAGKAPELLGYTDAELSCSMADLQPRSGYIGALAILAAGTVEVEIRPAEEVLTGDLV
jgi:4'-phosphopantetheinyl transferase